MIRKRNDKPEPYTLHVLSQGVPPEAAVHVSRAFRDYVDEHWGMQTCMSPPEPRGCLLDTMFPNVIIVDEELSAGQVVFVWYDGEVVMRKGLHYLKLAGSVRE